MGMKQSILKKFRPTAWLVLAAALVLPLGCSPDLGASTSPDTVQAEQLRKTTSISVRLYGLMDFETFGIIFKHPTSLEASAVPIGWMANTFRGFNEAATPTQKITDQVHGTITPDGKWLSSLVLARSITRTSAEDGVFYQVTFKNVPISVLESGLITSQAQGSDLRKHVESVEYIERSYSNGQLVTNTTYKTTDWSKDVAGQAPYILVLFEEGAGGGLPPC